MLFFIESSCLSCSPDWLHAVSGHSRVVCSWFGGSFWTWHLQNELWGEMVTGLSWNHATKLLPCLAIQKVGGSGCRMRLWTLGTLYRLVLVLFGSLASLGLNKCSHLSLENFACIVELLFSTALLYRCGGLWFVSWLCSCLHLVHWNSWFARISVNWKKKYPESSISALES